MPIVHRTVSTVPDDADPNSISPSDWNDTHVLPELDELTTGETDETLVLAPDGSGGVNWVLLGLPFEFYIPFGSSVEGQEYSPTL